MPKLFVKKGATSYLARIFIQDSSSTVGAGLSGLVFNTSGLVCYRARDDDGNAGGTAITLATATLGTWATGGFVEKDATHMKGVYEIGITNASLAAGSDSCMLYFSGATNMAPCVLEIQLVAFDPTDAVHLGLSSLPNVASGSAGAIPTTGTGSNQISVSSGQVILQAGTGTGQLDFTSGVVKANATQWLGGTIPAVNVTGVPLVDLKYTLGTISPAAAGSVGIDWAQVANKTSTVALTNTTVGTVTTVTNQLTAAAIATGVWTDTTAGDFTTALSVGKSIMNGVSLGTGLTINAYTGDTPQTGDSYARIGAAGAGLTAITGVTLAVSQPGVTIPTVTTVTNQLTAAAIATGVWQDATAGDFTTTNSIGKSLYNAFTAGTSQYTAAALALAPSGGLTGAQIATAVWTDTTAGDFTTALSVGKSVMNGVSLGTGLTVNALTTNNDKTGYSLTQTFPTNFSVLSITAGGRAAITSNTQKNAAGRITFVMTDATTHAPKTGLTVTSTAAIDGAAFGATVNAPTEVGTGTYTLVLAAADTNGNDIVFRFTAAGADDLNIEYVTQP